MINGCNGLISQQFGTHKLRTASIEDVVFDGIGDADFIEITGGKFCVVSVTQRSNLFKTHGYVQRPVLTATQLAEWTAGETVTVHLIAYSETSPPAAAQNSTDDFSNPPSIKGIISEPAAGVEPENLWQDNRIVIAGDVDYLHLGRTPRAWHWNLLMFLGGLLLAAIPEALRFNAKTTE